MPPKIIKIIIPINHPKFPLSDSDSVARQVPRQQYSPFFVKVASPSQISFVVQIVPDISSQVSSAISKSSGELPSGSMNKLNCINRVFCFSF